MNLINNDESTHSSDQTNTPLESFLQEKLQHYPGVIQPDQLPEIGKVIGAAIETAFAALAKNGHRQLPDTKKRKAQVEVCPSEAITYSPFFKETVLPELLKYFAAEHHAPLKDLILNGTPPHKPLQFRGRANQLVELFKRAKYNRHIVCYSNTPLQEWICKFYTYQTKEGFAQFNPPRVADLLKNIEKEGVAKNHILQDILPYQSISERKK